MYYLYIVLQILEQLGLKGNTNTFEDFAKLVVQEIKKQGLKHMYKLVCYFITLNISFTNNYKFPVICVLFCYAFNIFCN